METQETSGHLCKLCENELHPALYSIGVCGYCLVELEEQDDSWVESYSFGYEDDDGEI